MILKIISHHSLLCRQTVVGILLGALSSNLLFRLLHIFGCRGFTPVSRKSIKGLGRGVVGNTLIHGTCFITGNGVNEYGEYDSCSLTKDQFNKYTDKLGQSVILGEELAVPTQDESQEETIEQALT